MSKREITIDLALQILSDFERHPALGQPPTQEAIHIARDLLTHGEGAKHLASIRQLANGGITIVQEVPQRTFVIYISPLGQLDYAETTVVHESDATLLTISEKMREIGRVES